MNVTQTLQHLVDEDFLLNLGDLVAAIRRDALSCISDLLPCGKVIVNNLKQVPIVEIHHNVEILF